MTTSETVRNRRLKQLTQKALKDAAVIHSLLYPVEGEDLETDFYNARSRREAGIRAVVLYMSLSIESLLGTLIGRPLFVGVKVRAQKPTAVREYERFIESGSIGFEAKLTLARILRIITSRERNQLETLKTLRNKCAHSWQLDIVHKRARKQKPSKRLLEFEGRNLFNPDVLDHFMNVYSRLYLKLFMKASSDAGK